MDGIHLLKMTRDLMRRSVAALTKAQLTTIPEGCNNHILWHLGHVVVTQQLLHYKLSGLPMHVDDKLVELFKRGTSPGDWSEPPDTDIILSLLVDLPDRFIADYENGLFQNYQGFTMRSGAEFKTLEDVVAFNHYHEGIHGGYVLAMRRQV